MEMLRIPMMIPFDLDSYLTRRPHTVTLLPKKEKSKQSRNWYSFEHSIHILKATIFSSVLAQTAAAIEKNA